METPTFMTPESNHSRGKDATGRERAVLPLCLLLFPAVAAYGVWDATSKYGVGLSPDSVSYVRLARNILESGLAFLGTSAAVSRPPVYPLELAMLSFVLRMDPLAGARVYAMLCAAAVTGLLVLSARSVTRFPPALVFAGAMGVFSVPLFRVSTMAWSEGTFIATVLLLFLAASQFGRHPGGAALCGLLAGAACLTRYVGVILIPLVGLHHFFFSGDSMKRRSLNGGLYMVGASICFAAYAIRNQLVSGTFLGPRSPSDTGFLDNLRQALNTLSGWFSPGSESPVTGAVAIAIVALLAVFAVTRAAGENETRPASMVFLHGGFLPLYLAFLLVTSTTTAYDRIDDRLMAPVFPSFVLLAVTAAAALSREAPRRSLSLLAALTVLGMLWPASVVLRETDFRSNVGAGGYHTADWKTDALIASIEEAGLPDAPAAYSNAPDALYLLAGVDASLAPRKRAYHSTETTGVATENLFDRFPDLDGGLLVWFDRDMRSYLYSPDELRTMAALTPVRQTDDGSIYRVTRRADSPTGPAPGETP